MTTTRTLGSGCTTGFSARIGVAKTNGLERQLETVLATPIRTTEQEGMAHMIATLHPASPPKRATSPVRHLSAGRHLVSIRYTVGWPGRGIVKIGCASSPARVKRFSNLPGAELIDLTHYPALGDDLHSEIWLQGVVSTLWPAAFQSKDEARSLMGNDAGGWTEFYAVPVDDWDELRRLAAI